MFLCYASKGMVFVCKVSDFRTKTLGYNLQKIANFLQNHGVFVNLVQEFTKKQVIDRLYLVSVTKEYVDTTVKY